jgi:uncharacterized protein YkwD
MQMQYQSKLDKKNTAQFQARERRALQEQKKQKNIKKPKTENKNLTPSLTIPPVPYINPIQTSIQSQDTIIPYKSAQTYISSDSLVPGVDMTKIRNKWLEWTNEVRIGKWLAPYILDARLDATATEWSQFSKERGYIIHGRPWDGCTGEGNYQCYNFAAIDKWFKERGIDPVVRNRVKHTENIGNREYSCHQSDCTNEMISAIKKTFEYFRKEEGKSYDLHYKSLVNPYFTRIGIGLTTDDSKGTYYLTVHYITE